MIIVFAGPSLRTSIPSSLQAHYRPPAAQGDVYKATLEGPSAIGIIDGYFDRVPAVWHKEILWALHRGIHVIGGASMGALRAAELTAFGMIGVGRVFEDFSDGTLEDDDEVAVSHGDAASGYQAYSDAMVDIRQLMSDATRSAVVPDEVGRTVIAIAKATHYRDRRLQELIACASGSAVSPEHAEALLAWLDQHYVSRKEEDARAVIAYLESHDFSVPFKPPFVFERTIFWEELRLSLSESVADPALSAALPLTLENLRDEVRLSSGDYREVLDDALLRLLARRDSDRQGFLVDDGALIAAIERFRREAGLLTAKQYAEWKKANNIFDLPMLRSFFASQARLYAARDHLDARGATEFAHALRARGSFACAFERAYRKRVFAKQRASAAVEDSPDAVASALSWYTERTGFTSADARRLGFPDQNAFVIAVCREYDFTRAMEEMPVHVSSAAASVTR